MKSIVIELTQGFVTVVSKIDYDRVNQHKWHVHMSRGVGRQAGKPYARTEINGKKVYMHRFITGIAGTESNLEVDHKNRCTLDNRRENLECVESKENLRRQHK